MSNGNEGRKNRQATRAYICLGANVGDRVGFVQQAMQFLKDDANIEVVECSSFYETEPVGAPDDTWFVNAVAAIETELTVDELLTVCQDIEDRLTQLHKVEPESEFEPGALEGDNLTVNEPICESLVSELAQAKGAGQAKIIDLDILFYGEDIVTTTKLVVPHRNLHKRAYALVPLLEVAPDLVHPGFGITVAELHDQLPAPELVYLYGTRGLDLNF